MSLTDKLKEYGNNALNIGERALYHTAISAGIYFGGLKLLENESLQLQDPKTLTLVGALAVANAGIAITPLRSVTKSIGKAIASTGKLGWDGLKWAYSKFDAKKSAPYIAAAGLVVGTAYAESKLHDFLNVDRSLEQILEIPKDITGKTPLERLHQWGYREIIDFPDLGRIELADKESMVGRLQRAYRWSTMTKKVEDQYGIPRGTLLAMAMHESYGNPVQPNAGNDGGIGLLHMQGPEAKRFGLKIYGDSHSSHDRRHGLQLKQMIMNCEYDPACISKHDDRGHMIKNLDAAARYMLEGFKKHGNWDKGIMHYRGPGHADRNTKTGRKYVALVKENRTKLNQAASYDRAALDFNKRNAMDYKEYLRHFHRTANNWGLHVY